MRSSWLALVLLAPVAASAASTAGTEVSLGLVDQPTPDDSATPDPRTYFSASVNGNIEIIENRLVIDGVLSSLRDEGSSLAYQGLLGVELTPNDHWSFGVSGFYSPARFSDYQGTTSVALPLTKARAAKIYRLPTTYVTDDSSGGVSLSVGYDTFGESNLEGAFNATVGWTQFSLDEDLEFNSSWRKVLIDAGKDPNPRISGTLNQMKVGISATGILFMDTDVTARFAWYFYDEDPSVVGYGRVIRGRMMVTAGAGLPIAPLRWELRPMITHRFTSWLSTSLSGGVGTYFDDGGTLAAGLKVSVKPVSSLKISLTLTLQRDVDPPDADALLSRYVGVGTSVRF